MADIELLLQKSFKVIDILPERVPDDRAEDFFEAEKLFLSPERYGKIRSSFAQIVLKLSLYYDIECFVDEGDGETVGPSELYDLVEGNDHSILLLIGERSLLKVDRDDLYMTLYNADADLLLLVRDLAMSEGLFVR